MIGDPEDLKVLLSLPDGTMTNEERLRLLLASNGAVKAYCGRNFELATYTEYPEVGPGGVVLLKEWPVTQITGTDADAAELGVWRDISAHFGTAAGAFAASTKLVSGTDFCLDPDDGGRLYLLPGCGWYGVGYGVGYGGHHRSRRGSLRVRYVAGYAPDDLPADLVAEVVAEAAARWAAGVTLASGGGAGSASGGGSGQSVQLGQFRVSQTSTSTSSSRTAAGAGKATEGGHREH
jgi:hypothetical protein